MGLPISELVKQACIDLGLEEPIGTLVTSSNKDIKKLFQYAIKTGWELRDDFNYPQLKQTHTFDTIASTGQYTLPSNFWKMISSTQWNQDESIPVSGPLTDQEWNYRENYSNTSQYNQKYRIFGAAFQQGEFFITPTPGSAETISFDYIRSDIVLPKLWEGGETVGVGDYRTSNGKLYKSSTGGTCGGIAPKHEEGSVSDGFVLWGRSFDDYAPNGRFQDDTDITLFEDDIMILGMIWRFLARDGMDYQKDQAEYYKLVDKRAIKSEGAPILRQSNGSYFNEFTYRDDQL